MDHIGSHLLPPHNVGLAQPKVISFSIIITADDSFVMLDKGPILYQYLEPRSIIAYP